MLHARGDNRLVWRWERGHPVEGSHHVINQLRHVVVVQCYDEASMVESRIAAPAEKSVLVLERPTGENPKLPSQGREARRNLI